MRWRSDPRGFTLVEMMAAISVFALITVGLAPLLASSMRGAQLGRSYTVGKNVGQDAMERIRGLTFSIQNTLASPRKIDLLDFYYPDATAATSSSSTGYVTDTTVTPNRYYYRTVCTSATTTDPACPIDPSTGGSRLPTGYRAEFTAAFVQRGTLSNGRETYIEVPPNTGYTWTSVTGQDAPKTRLVEMTVAVTWPVAGVDRTFTLRSLIGDRRIGDVKVQGTARVSYVAEARTSFVDASVPPRTTDLVARVGSTRSEILQRLLSTALQDVSAGTATLSRPSDGSTDAVQLGAVRGAVDVVSAPPDQTRTTVTATEQVLTHPDFAGKSIAFLSNSSTQNVRVGVANDLPIAQGGFQLNPSGTESATYNFWVNNQAEGSVLKLAGNPVRVFSINPTTDATNNTTVGTSSATTTALSSSDRKVQTLAQASFKKACLMPVTYVTAAGGPCLVNITDFSANVDCNAKPTTGTATGTYSFRMSYYSDLNRNGTIDGSYVPLGGLDPYGSGRPKLHTITAGTTATNVLAPLKGSENPLVYDAPASEDPLATPETGSPKDLYLFPVSLGGTNRKVPTGASVHANTGYLNDWTHLLDIPRQVTNTGRSAAAQIKGALRITTEPTDPLRPETSLNISIGSLDCSAVDNR